MNNRNVLVSHRVRRNIVADNILAVPSLATFTFNLNGELGEIEQWQIRLEFLTEFRQTAIGNRLGDLFGIKTTIS